MMADWFARIVSVVGLSISVGSLYFTFQNHQARQEHLEIVLLDQEFTIALREPTSSEAFAEITLTAVADIYNSSDRQLSALDVRIPGGWTGDLGVLDNGDRIQRQPATCSTPGFSPTVIEARTSLTVALECRVRGGPRTGPFLAELLDSFEPADELTARRFLYALYNEESTDFYGNTLREGLGGITLDVTRHLRTAYGYGTTAVAPFRVWAATRTGNHFQVQYYIYLGVSSYR